MNYRLYGVRVFSQRWGESLTFYRDVIGLPIAFANAELGWAQFDLGGAYLGVERCEPDDAAARGLVGRFTGISIAVPDIRASYASLRRRGVHFDGPPEPQLWGGIIAHFRDLDDNVLTLLGIDTEAGRTG